MKLQIEFSDPEYELITTILREAFDIPYYHNRAEEIMMLTEKLGFFGLADDMKKDLEIQNFDYGTV